MHAKWIRYQYKCNIFSFRDHQILWIYYALCIYITKEVIESILLENIYIYILVIWLFSDHTLSMTTQKICVADVAKKLLQAIRKRFEFDKHTINWTLWIGNGILRKQMLRKRCLLEKEVMDIFTAKDVSDNSKNYLIDTSQICI